MIGGSLFSGIEGFGLGLLWSGMITSISFQVEIDPFCRRVLEARFPGVDRNAQDIRSATARSLPACDLLFGGFPCQDISGAGKGAGLAGARSGLWSEFRRLIEEIGPTAALVENVASGAKRWVCAVRSDLRTLGYRTRAYHIGVDDCGGPHRRKRIFVLAYARHGAERLQSGRALAGPTMANAERMRELQSQGGKLDERRRVVDGGSSMANADGARRQGADAAEAQEEGRAQPARCSGDHDAHRAKSDLGPHADGIPGRVVRWPAGPGPQETWEPPRLAASVPERAAKLRAIGNSVSPIQAYHVGLWAKRTLTEAVL